MCPRHESGRHSPEWGLPRAAGRHRRPDLVGKARRGIRSGWRRRPTREEKAVNGGGRGGRHGWRWRPELLAEAVGGGGDEASGVEEGSWIKWPSDRGWRRLRRCCGVEEAAARLERSTSAGGQRALRGALDGANGWNEDRRENPEYAARGSSDCKMHGVMQRVLEVT
jgi:hypothetical protein